MRIENKDCFEFLKTVEDNSVDLVLIDPPYNINKDSRWDKWNTVDEYVEFMLSITKECERVLKENGTFYFFHNDFYQISKIQEAIDKYTELKLYSIIIWNKPNFRKIVWGNVSEKNKLRSWFNINEFCLMYSFDNDFENIEGSFYDNKDNFSSIKYYLREQQKLSGLKENDFQRILNFSENSGAWRHYLNSQWTFIKEDKYLLLQQNTNYFKKPYSELLNEYNNYLKEYEEKLKQIYEKRHKFNKKIGNDYNNVWISKSKQNKGKLHPTQKPLDLIEKIILTSTNENDVVLDCFLGSGTTAVAALKNKRKILGCERDENYFNVIQERIKEFK